MFGIAVNVTLAPVHIVVWLAVTETVGVTLAADIVIILLVAVGEVVHEALLVMITVTWSLFASVVEVNVGLSVPVFEPFTLHWYDGVVPPFTGVAVNVTLAPKQIEV